MGRRAPWELDLLAPILFVIGGERYGIAPELLERCEETLRIPMGTVMSRLHRGRRLLQSRLYDYVAHRHLVGREALAEAASSRSEVSH